MNREIEFRGLTLNGDMVYGHYATLKIPLTGICTHYIIVDSFKPIEVIPETVGQFTGFRDSKRTAEFPEGQNIFEGDELNVFELIFDSSGPLPDVLNVKFSNGMFQLFREEVCLMGLHLSYIKRCEVINK